MGFFGGGFFGEGKGGIGGPEYEKFGRVIYEIRRRRRRDEG